MNRGSDEEMSSTRRAGFAWVVPDCTRACDLRFAFVNLSGHPRGESMLSSLISAGFLPRLVISEQSTEAVDLRSTQEQILAAHPNHVPAPSAAEVCARLDIPFQVVDDHNDASSMAALREAEVDVVVLGDTRLVRADIISEVPHGVINVHPGVIPDVRGNNPYIWAVVHGLRQGVTAHLIDAGVDRGPVLAVRDLPPPGARSIPDLIKRINDLCAEIVVDTLNDLVAGRAVATPQASDSRLTFRKARPEVWSLAGQLLAERAARSVAA